MGLSIPLSCVRLLVPPLRLISAFIWRAVQQHNLEHYDKVEENILLITKMIPEILSERQRTALIMGLRAKMILEMCKEELPTDLHTVKARLKTIESSSMFKSTGSEVEILQGRLLKLVVSLLEDPAKKENFFKEIFPIEYGPEFDKALQVLVGHFLSRLEQLLPVPNFKQAAKWLDSESLYWEDVVHVHWDPNQLLPLLQSDYHGILEKNELPSLVEDRIISSLSLSVLLDKSSPTECKIMKTLNTLSQRNQDVIKEMETDVSALNLTNQGQDVVQEIEIDIPELVVPSSVQEIETDIPDLSVPTNIQDVIQEIETDVSDLSVLSETQDVVQEIETDIPDLSVPSSIQDVVEEINTDLNVLSSIHGVVQEIETDIPDLSSNQDVIQDSESDLIPLQNFNITLNHEEKANGPDQIIHVVDTLNQEESSEAEEFASSLTSEMQKQEFREKNISESHFYKAEVQTVSKCEGETTTEIKRSKSSSELTDTHQTNGGEKGHETSASESNSGQRLKVIVPKHLVPVVKEISLPSVLLARCTRSQSVQNKQALNASTKSSFSENTRSLRRRPARSYKPGHTGSGNYKCVHCNLSFKTHFQASVHRRKKHVLIYSCPKCEKSFKSLKAWTKHRTEHKEEKPQQCTDCGEQCPNLQALVAHSKLHNHIVSKTLLSPGRAAPSVKRPPGECRFCGEMFTPIELRNHLKTHPEFRPHQCDHCGRCFANLSNLLAHISNHTGEKPHICQNCGKKFFSKALLKSHMKSHSKERLYCCSYCGKCFQNAGNLNIHMRIHTGEKPYTCLECGKAFSSAGRLQVHRRCHTGEKPYECNVCGRGFVVSSHRTIHMRSHTGVRPFTCEICGKTFARRNCWNEHMYSHTDAKPFPCSVCSKSFIRRSHLKRHMQSHNSDQINVL